MPAGKGRKTRDQPLRGKNGRDADRQVLGLGSQNGGRLGDQLEGLADIVGITSPGLGQNLCPGLAQEQLQAQWSLQIANVLGDCALRDTQFLGHNAKVQIPGRHFENRRQLGEGNMAQPAPLPIFLLDDGRYRVSCRKCQRAMSA